MRYWAKYAGVAILLATAGCGEADNGRGSAYDLGPDPDDMSAQAKPLAIVQIPTGEVSFFAFPGPKGVAAIGISESVRIGMASTPVAAKLNENTATSLEVFMALTQEAPPDLLVEAHALEALALGRKDTQLIPTEIDVNAFVEKLSFATCDNYVYDLVEADGFEYATRLIGKSSRHSGGDSEATHNYYGRVYTGVCNDGTNTIGAGFFAAPYGEFYDIMFPIVNISPGYLRRYWLYKLTPGHPKTRYTVRVYDYGHYTNYHVVLYGYADIII